MNDMERRKFEESFKEAFKNAEVQPSEKVWTNVELDLIKAEGEKMKRRIFFYQMLAAASISFAVIFAGVGFYALKENRAQQIALIQANEKATGNAQENTSGSQSNASVADAQTSKDGNSGVPAITDGVDSKNPSTDAVIKNKSRVADQSLLEEGTHNDLAGIEKTETISRNHLGKIGDSENVTPNREPNNAANSQDVATFNNGLPEAKSGTVESNSVLNSERPSPTESGAFTENVVSSGQPAGEQDAGRVTAPPRELPSLYRTSEPVLVFHQEKTVEADPVQLMFARLNDLEKELARAGSEKEKSASKEKLWTSVGFAAGAFSAISGQAAPQTAPSLAMTNNSAAQNQTRASGVAYSMAVTMGTQIADRWVLQGGVSYLTEMSDYTSTQAVQESGTFKAASVNQFRSSSSTADATEKFIPTAPYTVNNSNEYLSIPLQAGYLIVKRKVQWQFNAGVSTDLFLQNTVDPEGNMAKTTSGAGDDSPFRTVNFSGLVGSEVSYRFGDRYRVGLNPGLRYPLNSIYKDNLGLESSPLTFDIGLRFRYIFK